MKVRKDVRSQAALVVILAALGALIFKSPGETHVYFFPYFPATTSPLKGVEFWEGEPRVAALDGYKIDLARYSGFRLWKRLEPVQGARDWDAISGIKSTVDTIRFYHNVEPLFVFVGFPDWAKESACSPLEPEYYDDFAQMVVDVVLYMNLKKIEVLNEMDATGGSPDHFGCWGDAPAYVDLFEITRAAVKSASPDTEVWIGGFMFQTDTVPFIDYVLENIPDPDGVGFHHYPYFAPAITPPWVESVPLAEKLSYLRQRTGAPIVLNETNLVYDGPCSEDVRVAQRDYFESACELAGTCVVYAVTTLEHAWRCAAVLDNDEEPLAIMESFNPYPPPETP